MVPQPLILVVDDDEHIRTVLATLLEIAGYRVETAANGIEALEAVAVERPALIVLDIWMPVLDGFGVAQALARQGTEIPIIVMTAGADAEVYAHEIGAVAGLMKPLGVDGLLDVIEGALKPFC
jgi:two-component system response regulator MprA